MTTFQVYPGYAGMERSLRDLDLLITNKEVESMWRPETLAGFVQKFWRVRGSYLLWGEW